VVDVDDSDWLMIGWLMLVVVAVITAVVTAFDSEEDDSAGKTIDPGALVDAERPKRRTAARRAAT
jgi:hypothetical protein